MISSQLKCTHWFFFYMCSLFSLLLCHLNLHSGKRPGPWSLTFATVIFIALPWAACISLITIMLDFSLIVICQQSWRNFTSRDSHYHLVLFEMLVGFEDQSCNPYQDRLLTFWCHPLFFKYLKYNFRQTSLNIYIL